MVRNQSPARRTVLAALGALGCSTILTATATAQERTQDDLNRPRTVEERGLEITMYDCSRFMIEGDGGWVEEVHIDVDHQWERPDHEPGWPYDIVGSGIELVGDEVTLPLEVNVNTPAYHEELDVPEGSIAVGGIHIFDSVDETQTARDRDEAVVDIQWPRNEWDCLGVVQTDPELW